MVPRPLARRIDRLSRRAHAFHRFAHHPLCDRYAGELVALGHRARICRGCTLATLGAAAGIGLGCALPFLGAPALAVAAILAATVVIPKRLRLAKGLTRLLPTAALTTAFTAGLRQPSGLLSAVALILGAGLFVAYRSRGPHKGPCESCPERSDTIPCSGVQPILRREAAFRRITARWMSMAGI